MTRTPINFPLGGLSDDDAFSSQKPGTTREAVNVRGVDPVTGRARGAQREGMSKYISAPVDGTGTNRVQDLAIVTRDLPKVEFENVHFAPGDGVPADPAPVSAEWSKLVPGGSEVLWIAVDFAETAWALVSSGVIRRYNTEGTLLTSISPPVPDGQELVAKVAVDIEGGVYVASRNAGYTAGRVWRFRPSSTSTTSWDLDWTYALPAGGVEMFDATEAGVYFVLRDDNKHPNRQLALLSGVTTSTPSMNTLVECPGPVNALSIDEDGSVKLAVEENSTRGAGPASDGFTKKVPVGDLWSPHELENASQRLYFWVAADNVDGQGNATLSDGDPITTWADNRQRETTAGNVGGSYTPVSDITARELYSSESNGRQPPRFASEGLGGMPSVRFSNLAQASDGSSLPGQVLISAQNSTGAKASADARWEESKAVFPNGVKHITCIVARPALSTGPRLLLSQNAHVSGSSGVERCDQSVLLNAELYSDVTSAGTNLKATVPPGGTLTAPYSAAASGIAPGTWVAASFSFWVKIPACPAANGVVVDMLDWGKAASPTWGLKIQLESRFLSGPSGYQWRVMANGYGGPTPGAASESGVGIPQTWEGQWVHFVVVSNIPGENTNQNSWYWNMHVEGAPNGWSDSEWHGNTANPLRYPGDYAIVFGDACQDGLDDFRFILGNRLANYAFEALGDPDTALQTPWGEWDGTLKAHYIFSSGVNAAISGATHGGLLAAGGAAWGVAGGLVQTGASYTTKAREAPGRVLVLNPDDANTNKNALIQDNQANPSSTWSHPPAADPLSTNGAFVLTIINNGSSSDDKSGLRLNGRYIDSLDFPGSDSAGSYCRTVIGCREQRGTPTPNPEDLYPKSAASGQWDDLLPDSFAGDICEIITVLADSSGDIHNDDFVIPGQELYGAGRGGSVTQWIAGREPSAATEVELLEGYLAHKYGFADALPHGSLDAEPVEGSTGMGNHPFGGTGQYPVRADALGSKLHATQTKRDLWTLDSAVLKYDSGSGLFSWVCSGGGAGYALAVGDDSDVVSYGPTTSRRGQSSTHYGPYNTNDTWAIMRRFLDLGDRWGANVASRGFIYLRGKDNSTTSVVMPQVGDSFTLNDGQTTPIVFTMQAASGPLGDIDISSATTPNEVLVLVVAYINATTAFHHFEARMAGTMAFEVVIRDDASFFNAVNAEIEVDPLAVERWAAFGLVDGQQVDDTWLHETIVQYVDGDPYPGAVPDLPGAQPAIDDNGDIWAPRCNLFGETPGSLNKIGRDGSLLAGFPPLLLSRWDWRDANLEDIPLNCVALPLSRPAYINQPSDPTGPTHLYVGSSGGELDPQKETLHRLRIVSETQNLAGALTPRVTRALAVENGSVYEFKAAGADPGLVLKGSGGEIALSPYVQSTIAFNKVFWCDGFKYWVYDSVLDTLEELKSKSAGEIPKYGKLIESWRGRLVISRTEEDPHNVYMSRVGDPFDWDEFPANPDTLEAVSFGQSRVGLSPDIVNALIPYNDDLMIIGGDHTIHRLTGDPNAAGQLDLVSDVTGIAYGRAWCKDPQGRLFFFGSKGGVFVMVPGGIPERITRDRIEKRMSDVDLSANSVRLVWNYHAEGLHVFVVPHSQPVLASSPASRAWFMDKNGAWWEDDFSRTNEAPTAVAVSDGDLPNDRVLLLGGGDGYVRYWDALAVSDDGQRIDSHVLLGPLTPADTTQQVKFMRPQVTLGAQQSGCDFEWFSSDTAELPGNPVASGKVGPGMNATLPVRTRGTAVWLRLRNAAIAERWAFERASVDVSGGGRERVR